MEEYVFASYANLLKDAWRGRISQVDLGRSLYDAVLFSINSSEITTSDISISGTRRASDIFRRKESVHNDVVSHKGDKAVIEDIEDYFSDNIVSCLENSRIEKLTTELLKLIEFSDRPENTKDELKAILENESLPKFLGFAYLESLARDNKLKPSKPKKQIKAIPNCDTEKFKNVTVPDEITEEESRYISALLEAYSEAEGIDEITIEVVSSNPSYSRHLERQRKDYFNAEFVRRSTRGAVDEDGNEPFYELEQEIHDGIIDIYEDDFENGLERLKACLKQAPLIEVARCWINADRGWLSVSVKKGVCHILVNESILKGWVKHEM